MLVSLDMPEALRISLKYNGPSVDDGTMPVEDVLDALHGFSGAYGKIASRVDPEREHQLRVTAFRTGSFELWILTFFTVASTDIQSLKSAIDSTRWVYNAIKGIVSLKKHTKGRPYDISVRGDNNTVMVINAEGTQLSVPVELFELFKSKLIDSDLNKIASPLIPDRVESAVISAEGDPEPAVITVREREAFSSDSAIGSQIETEIIGTFVSLNKERDSGTFRLGNGQGVPYRYSGDNPEKMHADFSHSGPVRVKCVATLDSNLEVDHIEIKSIERLQLPLPLPQLPQSSPE